MHIFIIFLIITIAVTGIILAVYYFNKKEDYGDTKKLKNNSLYHIHKRLDKISTKKYTDKDTHVYVLENFLSPGECNGLIESAQGKMTLSPLTSPVKDKKYRDSETCYFEKGNKLHNYIDQKISEKIGIENGFSEPSQIQHYKTGNQFKAHHDFFHPQDFDNYAGKNSIYKGQRTWTFTVYLNDVNKGGETEFVKMGIKIKPKKGMAVAWNNLHRNGDPNHHTMHCGKPVLEGEKYIITKWYRDRKQKI